MTFKIKGTLTCDNYEHDVRFFINDFVLNVRGRGGQHFSKCACSEPVFNLGRVFASFMQNILF